MEQQTIYKNLDIELLNKLVGIPWQEDGRDFSGIDCAGLMQLYCNNVGIEGIAPKSSEYVNKDPKEIVLKIQEYNEIVPIDKIQPEDILIFKIENELHCGLYLGYGRMLHARRNQKSVITKLGNVYQKYFLFAIRAKNGKIYIPPGGPPVAIAIAVAIADVVVATALGAAFWTTVIYAIGTFMVAYSIGLAIQAKQQYKSGGHASSPRYRFGELQTTSTNQYPVPIIYGKMRWAGNVVYQNPVTGGEEIDMLIVLCEGEIESVTDIRINGEPIANFSGCSYTIFLGTASQNVQTVTGLDLDGVQYRNVAMLYLHLKTSDKLKGGRPNITCIIEGKKVSTWNGSIWSATKSFSKNYAACIRDYLITKFQRGGCGYSSSDIDNTSFGEVYDYCIALVDNGAGGTEPRYEISYMLDQKKAANDNLLEMLIGFGGTLIRSGSIFKLLVAKSKSSVASFDEDEITDFKVYQKGLDQKINRLGIEYFDPDQDDARILVWGSEDKVDQDERGLNELTLTIPSINRKTQGLRLSNQYFYEMKICPISIEFLISLDAIALEIGDVIQITHSLMSWTNKLFIIQRIEEDEKDVYKITAQEYNSTIYNDKYGATIQTFDYGTPPNPYAPVSEVSNIQLFEGAYYLHKDGTIGSDIIISWNAPTDASREFLSYYQIELKKGTANYIVVGTTGDTNFRIYGVEEETYYIKIKTVSINNIISNGLISNPITIIGKSAPPNNVTGFSIRQEGDEIVFSWAENPDIDLFGYEIRVGDTWESGTVVETDIQQTTYRIPIFTFGLKEYHIKAIDTSRIYSLNAASASLNISYTNLIENVGDFSLDIWGNGKFEESEENSENIIDEVGELIVDENLIQIYAQPLIGFEINNNIINEQVIDEQGQFIINEENNLVVEDIDWADFLKLVYFTDHYATQGIYVSEIINLNSKMNARIVITSLIEGENFSYDLYIKTSDDNVIWSNWFMYAPGDYVCRYFKIKLIVTINNISQMVKVFGLKVFVTAMLLFDGAKDVEVIQTKNIVFTKTFLSLVRLWAIAQGSNYVEITNKTLNGFTATTKRHSDNALVTANIDWLAQGY